MSDCCTTIQEPALTWPSSWGPTAFRPVPSFPADWTASVFGQYDLRARACGCTFVHNVSVSSTLKDVFPPPPIWRTRGDYYQSYIDIVLGNLQPDSPAWLPAKYLRADALQPGKSGVVGGVVPLSWLAGVVVPGGFTTKETAAQAAAESAFTTGVTLEQIEVTLGMASDPFWSPTLGWSPLATVLFEPAVIQNIPRRIVATLTAAGVLTVDRASMTILAAARSQSLREVPLFVVYT